MKYKKRIQNYIDAGLGLERGQISLASNFQKWKRAFSDEAHFIYDHLRIESLRLYHCGSTSVPQLPAKPILDILGSVENLAELDQKKFILEQIGYEYKGEYGIAGRRYCVLYNDDKTIGLVHLHFFQSSSVEISNHLHFRDYLRTSKTAQIEYGNYKKNLINDKKISRANYSESKDEIIQKILGEANSKYQAKTQSPKKILAFLGAAKGHRNTLDFLIHAYPENELDIVDLNEMFISTFQYGVNSQDDFYALIERAVSAELIIWATPVYWYGMSTSMKNFIDRFSNLLSGDGKILGEALYGKKVKVISTGNDDRLPFGFESPFSLTAIYFGMDYLGTTYKSVNENA